MFCSAFVMLGISIFQQLLYTQPLLIDFIFSTSAIFRTNSLDSLAYGFMLNYIFSSSFFLSSFLFASTHITYTFGYVCCVFFLDFFFFFHCRLASRMCVDVVDGRCSGVCVLENYTVNTRQLNVGYVLVLRFAHRMRRPIQSGPQLYVSVLGRYLKQ